MADGRGVVKKALDRLKSILSKEDIDQFFGTTLDDIWLEARKIEREQAARLDMRFMRRIEPFLSTLESYANVLEVFCQGYAPMAFVWGPIKLILLLAKNYIDVMDKILQAFSDIASALPRLEKLKKAFPKDENLNQITGLIYGDISEFLRRAYKIFRSKAWHFRFAVDWGFFKRRFELILRNLAAHCELMDREAAAVHMVEMMSFREKWQFEEEEFERRRRIEMTQEVFVWLSAQEDQQEEYLHHLCDNRQPETYDWVLDDPQMSHWRDDDESAGVLWMTAIPGGGKSLLCSLMIQNLQIEQDRSVLYYFCSHQSSDRDTCATILRTFLTQILRQNLDMAPFVHQVYLQKASSRSSKAIRDILIEILPTAKPSRIIIDGLDEIPINVQQDVLKNILEVRKKAAHNCKVLISSREEPQIRKSLPNHSHLGLEGKTSQSLNLYIQQKVKDLADFHPWVGPILKNIVGQRLRDKAKGMFLWVRLVIATLEAQSSEVEFEIAIDQIPDGLDEAYRRILDQFNSKPPTQRERIFKILYWLCVSFRPIKDHEVVDGIALRTQQTMLNRSTRIVDVDRDIIELCAPLLERSPRGVLELVHFSAKEYLIHQQSRYFVSVTKAHFNIALPCIINLTTCIDLVPRNVDSLSQIELEARIVQGNYGLHSYASEFWAEHLLSYLEHDDDSTAVDAELIQILKDFSLVWRHRSESAHLMSRPENVKGLGKLKHLPAIYNLVLGWLSLKKKLKEHGPKLKTLDDQRQWKLQTDETFLSLIDHRLCIFTERILTMDAFQLPSHIDERDFNDFRGRFEFQCRFLSCNQCFHTIYHRDEHERLHMPSFPCMQCDFSERGFKSRRDLEKHIRTYHLTPEDFEIPNELPKPDDGVLQVHYFLHGHSGFRSKGSSRWNDRGRRALREGFGQVLARFEDEIEFKTTQSPERPTIKSSNPENDKSSENSQAGRVSDSLDNIRIKIEKDQYSTLADFKLDLHEIARMQPAALERTAEGEIEKVCREGLEMAVLGFPDLANLDDAVSTNCNLGAFTDTHGQPANESEDLNIHDINIDLDSIQTTPYWSSAEEKEFPHLLQRFGRDFDSIADCLKTKTVDNVDTYFQHHVRDGKADFVQLANIADQRIQQETHMTEATPQASDATSDNNFQEPPGSYTGAIPHVQQVMGALAGPSISQLNHTTRHSTSDSTDRIEVSEKPRTRKRQRPPRALCPHCTLKPEGLRDEWALIKHISRFHVATRKIWVCEDISVDHRFLSQCKSCKANKRYKSRNGASKHLRDEHFWNPNTSAETLSRWLREIEEPNPRFQSSESGTPASRTTVIANRMKRPKVERKPKFQPRPLNEGLPSGDLLPSMKPYPDDQALTQKSGSANLSDDAKTEDHSDDNSEDFDMADNEPLDEGILLPGVPFENFIPKFLGAPKAPDEPEPTNRALRALIKPSQVLRLPNLDQFRRSACLDQVEALHYRLNHEEEGSRAYNDALKGLTSLSGTLIKDIRDWHQQSTLAPNLPFSL